jgi:small subunit ribosomal protein S20
MPESEPSMAHHSAAKKSIRQTVRRSAVNSARMSQVRSFIKKVESAIGAGDKKSAAAALKEAQPIIQRGVRAGVLHRNVASRKLSRLNARIKALA